MKRRNLISLTTLALVVFALGAVAAVASGAITIGNSNEVPDVGVDAYFKEGVGGVSNLSAQSDLMVIGYVEKVGAGRWKEGVSTNPADRNLLNVYHPVRIKVDRAQTLKSGAIRLEKGSTVSVWAFGGRVDENTTVGVTDASRFEEGERALVFLSMEDNHYRVSGLKHGKFTVKGKTALRPRVGPQYRKEIPVQEIVDTVKRQKGRSAEPGR